MMLPTYRVRTWDSVLDEFTPDGEVAEFVTGQVGLRRAMRTLQANGYQCNRSGGDSDPSVLVERVESPPP